MPVVRERALREDCKPSTNRFNDLAHAPDKLDRTGVAQLT